METQNSAHMPHGPQTDKVRREEGNQACVLEEIWYLSIGAMDDLGLN